ncbi:MAG: hypothetical protein ACOYK9_00785 [Chlamydiia bacterium]
MKQMFFPLVQLVLTATWAIASDFEPAPIFIDTTEMQSVGDHNAKVYLIASFDPNSPYGERFSNEFKEIEIEFIEKGYVCYFENKQEGQLLEIFINGQNRTKEILTSSLSHCLSKEIFREL